MSRKTLVCICAILIVVGVLGIIGCRLFEDKDQNNNSKSYSIIDGEEYVIYERDDSHDSYELVESDEKISFDYPQFNIDSEDAKKINDTIKEKYEEAYKNIFDPTKTEGCIGVKKDNKIYSETHVIYYSYDVYENDKIVSISLTEHMSTRCASGGEYFKGYVINKETKKAMTNEELVNMFNVDKQNIINNYNKQASIVSRDSAKTIEDIILVVKDGKLYYVEYYGDGSGLAEVK